MTVQTAPPPAPSTPRDDPLAPVRDALLDQARRAAADMRNAASADAAEAVAKARRRAAEILAEAERQGAADGAALAAVERMRARRKAREIVLRAQRAAYDELRRRARAAVTELRDHSSYPVLRYRLARLARSRAGPGATLSEHPDGGVLAVTQDRRVDCSLGMLADRALEALGAEVEGLWTP